MGVSAVFTGMDGAMFGIDPSRDVAHVTTQLATEIEKMIDMDTMPIKEREWIRNCGFTQKDIDRVYFSFCQTLVFFADPTALSPLTAADRSGFLQEPIELQNLMFGRLGRALVNMFFVAYRESAIGVGVPHSMQAFVQNLGAWQQSHGVVARPNPYENQRKLT